MDSYLNRLEQSIPRYCKLAPMTMKFNLCKKISIKVLIMYLVSTLVFLSSIDLHIHTDKVAAFEDHGFSVSITSLTSNQLNFDTADEIEVSPDGMLKVQDGAPDILVIFLLLAIIVAVFSRLYILRSHNTCRIFALPFYGSPSLRGPPQ